MERALTGRAQTATARAGAGRNRAYAGDDEHAGGHVMTTPIGVHHLAVSTKDMKGQIEFFTQVMGAPLVALFDMHGVEGAWHGFVRLSDTCLLSFVQVPGVEEVESTLGVTHSGTGAGISAPGTMQHLAFEVGSMDELLGLRDRLRSNGIVTFGPIDHGMCQSIYFAGPEGLTLEAAHSDEPVDPRAWVDPAVCEAIGMTPEEVERAVNPPAYERPAEPVPQAAIDPAKPQMGYPPEELAFMVTLTDEQVTAAASTPDPPVRLADAS
jgi:catechol 2,3-dioxygenase-like lactoylglutathione lyase family enzyme